MPFPITIAFIGMPTSDAMEVALRQGAAHLERFCTRILSCHVTVGAPHQHQRKGRLYEVRIDLKLRGEQVVVNREHCLSHAHEDPQIAIRDAFRSARRVVEDYVRRRRGQVKAHAQRGPLAPRMARE